MKKIILIYFINIFYLFLNYNFINIGIETNKFNNLISKKLIKQKILI